MMQERTLIGVARARELIEAGAALAVDCRWQLTDPSFGPRVYAEGHIPGAVYANLDRDLSELGRPGLGRHPLPQPEAFASALGRFGITPETDVIAYDGDNGAYGARLWWLLRMSGHERVAVLDGGLAAWRAAGLPVSTEVPERTPTRYALSFAPGFVETADSVWSMLQRDAGLLVDARGPTRFRGEEEPIDRVAGHVPGARNRPFASNTRADGTFKPPEALRREFETLLGGGPPGEVVHMCGSGVTACHNLLAMEHAGLGGSRVYAGSWSGWISDPARPVATGA
jgi:thiosulfate/3-mercaptopyruvate sulfurtransferase